MAERTRIEAAIADLEFARKYGGQFHGNLTEAEWFWSPREYTTHIAWQVGHMAVSEYNLCIRRVRGRTAEDEGLVSEQDLERFGLGSTPLPDRGQYPTRDEILGLLEAVRAETLRVLGERTDADLDVPVDKAHPVFTTRLGAVEYSSQHELLHVGQIAMLRRMMGKSPIR